MIKFVPTPEQQTIINRLVDVVVSKREDDLYYRMSASAPAGTGKTQLSAGFFSALREADPSLKIGYFIFNSFMTDEIEKRIYSMQLENTKTSTYHAFFADNIRNNEEIKSIFEQQYGSDAIDYSKTFYSKREFAATIKKILRTEKIPDGVIVLLRQAYNDWLSTDETRAEFSSKVGDLITGNNENPTLRGGYKEAAQELYSVEGALRKSPIRGETTKELIEGFVFVGMERMMHEHKMTHSVYYKAVYEIAVENKIDLFKEFDVVIVDEAQDMDKMFKRLLLATPKPVLAIGDEDQAIYLWRGAVNTMEEMRDYAELYSLSYSFRYPNDIAQLSNLLRMEYKEDGSPAVFVTGRYASEIRSISHEMEAPSSIAKLVSDEVTAIIDEFDREYLLPQGVEEEWDLAKLTKEERAELAKEIIEKEKAKMKKTAKGKYITERRRYISKKASKQKTAFVCRNNSTLIQVLFQTLRALDQVGDNKDNIQLSLTEAVSDEFTKIRNLKFPNKVKKEISRKTGERYEEFVKGMSLEAFVEDYNVQEVLYLDKRYSFLLDSESFDNFKWLLEQLSSRATGSISKKDNKSMLVFTTVHGSKGKEFKSVYLGSDILKPNNSGEIIQEELNIAYVAITRAVSRLGFVSASGNEEHPLWEYYCARKGSIEEILKSKYIYTFPFGVTMAIERLHQGSTPLYKHTFYVNDGFEGLVILNEPIVGGRVQYLGSECKKTVSYYSTFEHRTITMRFSGECIGEKERSDEYFGVGKIADSEVKKHARQ